jgi:hypothetical protein
MSFEHDEVGPLGVETARRKVIAESDEATVVEASALLGEVRAEAEHHVHPDEEVGALLSDRSRGRAGT